MALNIASDDSSMAVKSRELLAAMFPEVTDFKEPLEGYESPSQQRESKETIELAAQACVEEIT